MGCQVSRLVLQMAVPWIKVNPNYKEINVSRCACRPELNFLLLSKADPIAQGESSDRLREL